MTIDLVPVISSNVHSVGHDPASDELHVRFKDRDGAPSRWLYVYAGVKAEAHSALVTADSVGGHLHEHISGKHLDGKHPFRKVEATDEDRGGG